MSRRLVQGRSEVRLPHGNVEAHVEGFRVVGNHMNRTLRGAHKGGSSSPSHGRSLLLPPVQQPIR